MRKKIFLSICTIALLAVVCKNSNNNSNAEGEAIKSMEEAKELPLAFDPSTLPEEPVFDIKTTEGSEAIRKVEAFKEKPSLDTAKEYIADGSYCWNAGIFIWKVSTVVAELEQQTPVRAAK